MDIEKTFPPLALALALAACTDCHAPAPPKAKPQSPLVAAPEPSGAQGRSSAEVDAHIRALEKRLPPGFTITLEPPFVVAGNEDPATVRARARDTVGWATARLKQDFFDKEPTRILDVFLFKDAQSYRRGALELFHKEPTTPYGYYSSEHDALVMNIATGGGTLVHELVHPFVEVDFPDAPPWLNEGLGSLFEQSAEREGHIVGLTNWRLAGLQEAIQQRSLPPFDALLSADAQAFYNEDPGTNYGQARYLCYYLQERGLLTRFYREMRAFHSDDPTGRGTLLRVLGEQDLTVFQRRWERFVLALHFP